MFHAGPEIWKAAVTRNSAALKAIVAPLLALLERHSGKDTHILPRTIHSAILRVLRPAESALRRLIVIVARDVTLVAPPPRTASAPRERKERAGLAPASIAFQLFDPRKRFGQRRVAYAKHAPRVYMIAPDPPLIPIFRRPSPAPPPRESERQVDARRLSLRLQAFTAALDDLPRQANRLLRWRARREKRTPPTFIAPLRPGAPPGYRKKPQAEVDFILAECHSFAMGVLAEPEPDTS
jgi:hypothetical protein